MRRQFQQHLEDHQQQPTKRAAKSQGRRITPTPENLDTKHGLASKSYLNGDFYEGAWAQNVQNGRGRYTWSNGNQYVGEWRNGVINGRGVLTWANGNSYDGQWENGVPKGDGVFTWADGSCCYVGNWSRQALGGSFYPPQVKRICIWDLDGEAGDITCDIIDALDVCAEELLKKGDERNVSPKKPGEMILKGHRSYDLMLNLQLGIRYSVGKPESTKMRELRAGDFDPREKYWTRFPSEGSKVTPPHQSAEFRWKDYCPMVFRHLRKLFAVDPAGYMMAICGDDALREFSSPGKSGSFFYLTQDDQFMIKTVKKSEVKVLIRMLPSYYQHVSRYENSLLTKFFGVHCVKPIGGQKVRFVVTGNLFCSEHRIHQRFDLKGSSHGRTTDKAEGEIDETTTLKDLDLNFVFRLQRSWFLDLLWQIDRDCDFLEAEGIMDYSLLVGLHFRDEIPASMIGLSSPKISCTRDSFQKSKGKDMDRILDVRKPVIRLGANMLARAEHVSRSSNFEAYPIMGHNGGLLMPCDDGDEVYDVILYFGIIDILQDYDITKKLEHAYKSLHADPASISAVDPKLYSRRFRDFICNIFVEDND